MRRLLLIAGLVATAGGGAAANDLCGTTVMGDLTLDHDLVCSADGLVVGADGIRIDLNGHVIAGSSAGVGVLVSGHSDVTVANGAIATSPSRCESSRRPASSVRHNEFAENAEGIDVRPAASGTYHQGQCVRAHTIRAIMLQGSSSDNDVKNNTFTGNRIGVLLFGATDSELKDNLISGSSLVGIRFNVIAAGNTIKGNILTSNLAAIDFPITPTGSSIGNELKGNTLSANSCGLKGPTAGNTFKDNTFEDNAADACS
jgi:parallel beta-helix repeat protein